MNFYNEVLNILKSDERFFSDDGQLLRNAVYESAMQMDTKLIKALYANEETRKRFFTDINGIAVFDKIGFGWVINNREFLPDSYTRYKNKIGLVNNKGEYISASNDVELVFPYKDCVLEGGQTKEDQKRSEIFYNETLAPDEVDRLFYPKVFTNAKRYTADGVEKTDALEDTDNLIIKGNNLLAISSLLKKYEGKVRCVYIDPPYNPTSNANTFCYNNAFNRSTWLVFMKTRLELAKRFLSNDGVLIVAIDKNEQPRLQILIEEIYPEYDVDCITVIHNPRGTIGTNFSYTHEFAIFVTPKGKKSICNRVLSEDEVDWSPLRNWGSESKRTDAKNCFYPIIVEDGKIVGFGDVSPDDYHPQQTVFKDGKYYVYPIDVKGVERKWRYARQTVESIWGMLRAKKTKTSYDIEIGKTFGVYKTVWTDSRYDASVNGTKLLKRILPNTTFTYPKSIYNVVDCVNSVVMEDKNAIVLDFFGGSGTTGHAVMEINKDGGSRKFILVEQMDYIETDTLPRNVEIMKSIAPKSSIVYFELMKLNQNHIDAIDRATTDEELTKLYADILETGFISYKVNPKDIDVNSDDFINLSIENKKRLLMEILDKNQLYVNYCDIDDEAFGISEEDKAFTKSFYGEV